MKKDWSTEEVGFLLRVVLDLNLYAAIDGRRARNAQVSFRSVSRYDIQEIVVSSFHEKY